MRGKIRNTVFLFSMLALLAPAPLCFAQESEIKISGINTQTLFEENQPVNVVDWSSSTGQLAYQVEKTGDDGKKTLVMELNAPTGADQVTNGGIFTDKDVKPGNNYTYSVTAYDLNGNKSNVAESKVQVAQVPAVNTLPNEASPTPAPATFTRTDSFNGGTGFEVRLIEPFLDTLRWVAGYYPLIAVIGTLAAIVTVLYAAISLTTANVEDSKKSKELMISAIVSLILLLTGGFFIRALGLGPSVDSSAPPAPRTATVPAQTQTASVTPDGTLIIPSAPGTTTPTSSASSANAMDLYESGAYTGTQINSFLKSYKPNSPFSGQGDALVSLGQKYGVNPAFILAISNAESGMGVNKDRATVKTNAFGITCGGQTSFCSYGSWMEGAEKAAQLIRDGYKSKQLTNLTDFGLRWCGYENSQSEQDALIKAGKIDGHYDCKNGSSRWDTDAKAVMSAASKYSTGATSTTTANTFCIYSVPGYNIGGDTNWPKITVKGGVATGEAAQKAAQDNTAKGQVAYTMAGFQYLAAQPEYSANIAAFEKGFGGLAGANQTVKNKPDSCSPGATARTVIGEAEKKAQQSTPAPTPTPTPAPANESEVDKAKRLATAMFTASGADKSKGPCLGQIAGMPGWYVDVSTGNYQTDVANQCSGYTHFVELDTTGKFIRTGP